MFSLKHIPVRLFQMTVHHHSIKIFYVKGKLICFSFKGRNLICFFDSQEKRGRQCRNLHRKFCIWFQFTEFRQAAFSSASAFTLLLLNRGCLNCLELSLLFGGCVRLLSLCNGFPQMEVDYLAQSMTLSLVHDCHSFPTICILFFLNCSSALYRNMNAVQLGSLLQNSTKFEEAELH